MSELDLSGLDAELLAKYDRPGPRYTSYPTAPQFSTDFGETAYRERLREAARRGDEPLSMYVHLPFCHERCTFCGCNVVISPRRGPEEGYLDTLERELDLLAEALGDRRSINQLHWGGGTPTYLSPDQCERLFGAITDRFPLTGDAEVAIEVDPCVTTLEHLATLARLGFNRISMGLQDTDPDVQRAVRRIQPLELTREHVDEARRLGFSSVNIDLIYGLPRQTEASFRRCVRSVVDELAPDRLACFSYAHVPWIKPHQRQLDEASLPRGWDKLRLFTTAASELVEAGYTFVGFDHFARPGDELARALAEGRVHRNFMGYTVMPAADQVGIGVTSIGDVAGAYSANLKKLAAYERAVAAGRLPVERGLVRSREDELRRAVIHRLICTLRLDLGWVESAFGVDPREHFADALAELGPMAADGLVEIDDAGLAVTPTGRFFLRNLCMPFDAYLGPMAAGGPTYSRTV
ncbi:MAG: oxygen-independent coproporphyrinogen III oxidase [Thermoanaerobaculales bacterium]|jgi:oxygen-independent coproporphyrinogen-3 oxidase|nr:oxygen-independent coproporphyrinogen III oxidase [Thermoanaerobaculales bacterium]